MSLEERKEIPQRFINIADHAKKASSEEDVWNYKSEKFPLPDFGDMDWYKTYQPISSLYRIFDINVNYFGLKTIVEKMVCNAQYNGTFQLIRQLVCHCDGFHGWNMDQARERDEAEAAREVQQTPHGRRKESFVGERELREV